MILQGPCSSDHAGLAVDAGADWDGDGVLDVVLGGGGKIDLDEQSQRLDDYRNPTLLYLRGANTEKHTDLCEACEGCADPLAPTGLQDQPLQYPAVRLFGPQKNTVAANEEWMLADRYGWRVRFVGDVDGTSLGLPTTSDLVVSAPWYDASSSTGTLHEAGAVFLYLGGTAVPGGVPSNPTDYRSVDGSLFYDDPSGQGMCAMTITGAGPGDYFGFAIAGETDFDGDGIPDLVVGAPRYAWQGAWDPAVSGTDAVWPNPDDRAGSIYVVWGADLRAQLVALDSQTPPVDRTFGIDELIAAGAAIEITASTPSPRDRFGASVDGIGNHDSDSDRPGDEIVVGAPQFRSDWQGVANPSSAKTPTPDDDADGGNGLVEGWSWNSALSIPEYRFAAVGPAGGAVPGEQKGSRFGWSVSRISSSGSTPIGFIVGAPGFNVPAPVAGGTPLQDAGLVQAYDWAGAVSGTGPMWKLDGDDDFAELGWSVASGGDFDDDGVADVAVGARKYTPYSMASPCSCVGTRVQQAGRIYVVRGGAPCDANGRRVLAVFDGEQARDRLGFACAFTGDVVDGPGDDLVGTALAWPSQLDTSTIPSGPCPDGQPVPGTELGRAYVFSNTSGGH